MTKAQKDYPTEVVFLLAEDVREEARNKVSLLGVYAGDDIIIHGGKPGKRLSSLAFLVLIRDGYGTFQSKFSVRTEDGESLIDRRVGKIEKKESQNAILVVKFHGFGIPLFGGYSAVLSLDDKEYTYSFSVQSDKQD